MTIDTRYHVTCSVCGFLTGHQTFADALRAAEQAHIRHCEADEFVEVFDVMAHKGKPQTWTHLGLVVNRLAKS